MADPTQNPSFLKQLFDQLYSSPGANTVFNRYSGELLGGNTDPAWAEQVANTINSQRASYAETPLRVKAPYTTFIGDAAGAPTTGNALKTTGNALWQNMKAHKVKAGLTGLNAAGNLAGLFDNDKLLGQAVGTIGGGLAASKLLGLTPFGVANAAMLAGNVGALFDVLRSKKEKELQAAMVPPPNPGPESGVIY